MSEQKLLSKKDLRDRGWTHRQIRDLGVPKDRIRTDWKGRPAYGYTVSSVKAAEAARR